MHGKNGIIWAGRKRENQEMDSTVAKVDCI